MGDKGLHVLQGGTQVQSESLFGDSARCPKGCLRRCRRWCRAWWLEWLPAIVYERDLL